MSLPRRLTIWLVVLSIIHILPSSVTSIRLPDTTYPLDYSLQLDINVEDASYSGSVAIRLNVTSENVNLIALNYNDIEVRNVLIYKAGDTTTNLFARTNLRSSQQIIEFFTSENLIKFEEYSLKLEFSGAIRRDLKGLYLSTYYTEQGPRNIATTFFAPHYARMVFPCYDEPHYKATFDLQITHSDKLHALSNTPIVSQVPKPATNQMTTYFDRTPKMSSYLLAFIVSDLVASTSPTDNSIAVWSQTSRKSATQLSLQYAPIVKSAVVDYAGLPYEMKKLDLAAIDDFLMGAVENWGLITFLSDRLLADADTTTVERQEVVKVISHEIVHQFFGNLVTCQWWDDIWLNEGIANYLEAVITDKVANQWLELDQYVVNERIPAMQKDAERTHRKAMSEPVTSLEQIGNIYDFVAYPKAGSVLHMFGVVIGEDVLQETLREYLKVHRYGNVQRKDFFALLEEKASQLNFPNPQGISLSEAYENWAQNFGFPLVTVVFKESRVLHINQTRFTHSNFNSNAPNANFYVPLRLDSKSGTGVVAVRWLTPTNPSMDLQLNGSPSWVLFNSNAFGYYRVNYEESNWIELSKELHTTTDMQVLSRVQIIDDVMTLARFGHVSYPIALNLVRYIRKEKDYAPVVVALRQLEELEKSVRGLEVNITGLFDDTLSGLYKNYEPSASDIDKLFRTTVINFACQFGWEECIKTSHSLFDTYLRGQGVQPDLRKSMFCGAFQDISTEQISSRFEEILTQWTKISRNNYDRVVNGRHIKDIISAISCVRNEAILSSLLSISLSNDPGMFLTTSDRLKIFTAVVSGNVIGTGLALNMLTNNWQLALERYGSAVPIYNALGPNVVTPGHVILFNEIVFRNMKKKNNMTRVELMSYNAAMAAVRQVEENVQFVTNHRDQLTNWFKENYPGSSALKLCISSTLSLLFPVVISLYLMLF